MTASASVLLEGFGLVIHFLLEAEADYLCGVSLYGRSQLRTNYRSGYYKRKLSTPLGDVPLRVVHLKYLHPRVSMLKRAKRLSTSILDTLAQIYSAGVTPSQVSLLIQPLWPFDLPAPLLNQLSTRLAELLERWRSAQGNGLFCPLGLNAPVAQHAYGADLSAYLEPIGSFTAPIPV